MKSLKRLIAFFIAMSMLLSISVLAADFKDVEKGSTHEKAIDVLSDIGIVKGYEDGEYKPDKDVTRAEITSLLMRMVNLSITGIEVPNSYYTDVASNHWAVYDINTATDQGVIAGFGDGIFGPDRSVTYEQAVKMIVCLLGYDKKATDTANGYMGWPEGYMRAAREMGLLTNTQMDQKANAPRKIIAQLLYNALEIQMADTDGKVTNNSILKTYLQIEKTSGMIVANSKTTLDSTESIIKDDEIQIQTSDGVISRYKVGLNTEAIDMLGINVVAYTKYDETKTNKTILNLSTQGGTETVTVKAEDIVSFTASKLVYEADKSTGRTKEVGFSGGIKIIYNGKFIDTAAFFASSLKNITMGEVNVTASSGVSLVEITSYKNYVVKSVDTNNEVIYIDTALSDAEINDTTGGNSDLTDGCINTKYSDTINWNVKFIKNNSEIALNSIRKGNVISVKATDVDLQSSGANIIEVLVSDSKISGKITGTDEGKVTIASKEYALAPSLESKTSEASKLVYDASGTYYLDIFGNIAYFELGTSDSSYNGYITAAGPKTSGVETTIVINIMDSSTKKIKPLTFADKYTIDGTPYSGGEGLDVLLTSANSINGDIAVKPSVVANADPDDYTQPIRYTLNNSGLINSVTTVSNADFSAINVMGNYNYSSNTLKGSPDIKLDTSTIVYVVPNDRTNNDGYRASSKSYFGGDITYKIEAFGKNSSGAAMAVVVYSTGTDTELKYNSPLIVFIKKEPNNEGDTILYGYNFTSGADVTYTVEDPSDLAGIEKGDIIRFGTNASDEIANDKIYKYLDASDVKNDSYNTKYNTDADANREMKIPSNYPYRYIKIYGTNNSFNYYRNDDIAANRNANRTYTLAMALSLDDDTNTLRYTTDYGTGFDRDNCTESAFEIKSDVDVFVYDESMPETRVLTYVSDETEKDNVINQIQLYDYTYGTTADYVYLYGSGDSLQSIMIIKNNSL